ncbi:hypothetical protein [Pseudoduganella rhizocola]|uniref:hypothetical protein n=1 Tax=Pseudoduganella rhizocola TaxID=3382643 RepID=UPI0038B4BAF7
MRPRHAWLAALLFLHLLVLLAWRPVLRQAPLAVPRGELAFILPPKPAPATPLPPRSPAAARATQEPQRRSAPAAITVPPLPAASPAPAAVPDAFATPEKSLGEVARASVGDAMQALRKETPHAFLRSQHSGSAIARALARAGGSAGAAGLEEMVLPDGRRMTRVRTGGSSYCVVMDAPGGSGGRDVFRDGAKARTVTCPN